MKEWIEAAAEQHPHKNYQLKSGQLCDLVQAAQEETSRAIAAAYSIGYQRGRNYERNHRKGHTMKQIKAAVLWEAGKELETRQTLLDVFREQMTINDAADLFTIIEEQVKEQAAADPETATEVKSWTPADHLLWAIKEAYCRGQVTGHYMAQKVTKAQLEALERK